MCVCVCLQEGVTVEQLEADSPAMQQALSLKQQYHEVLREMGECAGVCGGASMWRGGPDNRT